MSAPTLTPSSPTARLRLHHPSTTASNVARNSIISSSAKGWSPLQINKRDSLNTSPMKSSLSPNPDGGSTNTSPTKYAQALADSLSPRRSSNSFKHVTKNSLVSNSPFKSPTTPQGAQAAGFSLEGSADKVVHERRSTRALGETPPSAKGVSTTSKAAIGLGITAVKPRSTSRSSSASKAAVAGQRRVSNERGKVAFPTVSTERRSSNGNTNSGGSGGVERRVSGSKENESPDVRYGKRMPRSSMGLKGLAQGGLVSKSPFKRTPSGSGLSATTSTRQNEESPSAIGIGPSPKTIPVERDDVFSSPSPRRVSASKQGQRRASPSKALSARTSHSPTPSPPSSSTRSQQLAIPANPGSAGPSPLSKSLSLENVIAEPTPTLTPHKSSMTPSRRLRGPRDLTAGCESPTRKTVTFQSIPDVKEFEALSAEPSADGSFDVDVDDGEEWIDDRLEREDSLEELLAERLDETLRISRTSPLMSEDNHSRSTTPVDSTTDAFLNTLVEEGLFSPPTMDTPAFEDQADFELPLESFDADTDGDRPFLSTPSLGDSVHATPILASEVFSKTDPAGIPYGRTHHAERAALAHSLPPFNGISSIPIEQPPFPHNEDHQMLMNGNAAKPSLPTPQYKPSTYEYNDPWATTPTAPAPKAIAHQSGPMPDPFITIQTATKTLLPSTREEKREEGGVPLGRTSHSERIQAARMLATQSLGLGMPGMPRSPAISKELTHATSYDDRTQAAKEEDDTIFDATLAMELPAEAVIMTRVASDESTTPRKLPKPPAPAAAPAPMPLDIPSPVASPTKEKEEEKMINQEKRSSKFELPAFSLPSIGFTSPFFNTNSEKLDPPPTIEDNIHDRDPPPAAAVDDNSLSSIEVDRPLTPPPALRYPAEVKESPHRLPDFDFGDMTLENEHEEEQDHPKSDTVELAPPIMPSSSSSKLTTSTSSPSMTSPPNTKAHLRDDSEVNTATISQSISAHSLRSEFGPSASVSSGSGRIQDLTATSKVRQRISREMIRETIQQRIAEGSLSRKPATASEDLDLTPEEFAKPTMSKQSSFAGKDKDLPPPPSPTELAPKMVKAHTTDAASAASGSGERPKLRPRSQTQSAHDVLKQIVQKDGLIDEPKSALDKLAMSMPMSQEDDGSAMGKRRDVSGSIAAELPPAPTSILRNPSGTTNGHGQNLLPPPEMNANGNVNRARSPSPTGGMREREQAIIARRREKERQASGVSALSTGSRRSRRSLSTGDVGEEAQAAKTFRHSVMAMGNPRLTLGINDDEQSILDAFREETNNIGSDRGYKVRERHVVRASYQKNDKVGHSTRGGDIDNGKAWKSLRRPSDIHEHASEIRALKAKENENGKASGTIFVKVLGIENLQIPLPDQQTFFCVTLDNGIDYIRTPYSVLADGAKVNQEFSLVEHPNFEFSLSIDIRRDPHILKLLHEQANPPRPITPAPTSGGPSSHRSNGFRSLFASPRKPKTASRSSTPVPPASASAVGSAETIVKYLSSPSGSTIAKTHVAFKPIAKNCEARVLEIRYPMFAMFKGGATGVTTADSASGSGARKQIAKITLQIFRLPPIPGLKPEELPQCIDECLRGMRHHAWHEHEYHEGVLTQDGGDCTVPKRRLFKLIGGNLVAINEVTKKEVTKIDLRQAESVSDLNANTDGGGTPKSRMTMRPRNSDEGLGVRPRSFALEFKDGDRIVFSADTDQSKEAWMTTLNGLIGKIPSNPLWAELLATRQRERQAKRTVSSSSLAKEARRHASGVSVGVGGEKGRPVSMPMGGIRTR